MTLNASLSAAHPQRLLAIQHLVLPHMPAHARGWSDTLPPGVSLLLDDSGDLATHWMPALAGCEPPLRGHIGCQGIRFPQEAPAYQALVFWRNPREPVPRNTQTAREWACHTASLWPTWDDTLWQAHVAGFALTTQLDKPLWHLSTGSLRKLWMAAALASGATLTLIDEPTAGLDAAGIRYLSHALETLGDDLATGQVPPRWVLVAHWESLPGVTWNEIIALPATH